MRFKFIKERAKSGEISTYCRLLKVTQQGYKRWLGSLDKPYKYAEILAAIKAILSEDIFNKNYGKKRIFERLRNDGWDIGYHTVANILRGNGLIQKKNKPKGLTKADKLAQKADNLIKRDFSSEAPNKKVVTDITEFAGIDGKVYVSAIYDCFDNSVLGVSMADNMRKELVIATYEQACGRHDLRDAISHSDRGSQYTSADYVAKLAEFGVVQSMNSGGGRCHDNAKCESQWGRMKVEIGNVVDWKKLKCKQIKTLIFSYLMDYWNNRRICSAIGGVPPMVKRTEYYRNLAEIAA